MKGKIIHHSNNVDTYVNIIAAMYEAYGEIKEITLSFIDSPVNEKFIDSLQERLTTYDENPIYKKSARVHLSGESISIGLVTSEESLDVIDVSALPKEMAIEVVASTIDRKNIKVCTLQWPENVKFDPGEKWVLRDGNHSYSNLVSKGALAKLYRNYFQKKQVIWIFAAIFSVLICMAIIKYIVPDFAIPSDIVNILSLLVGAAGLYLAAVSLSAD